MKKYLFISGAVILNGVAVAQQPSSDNQQLTSGIVGIVAGQTARWNVVYPVAPAPILQEVCSVTLSIVDDQGDVLKTTSVSEFVAGKSVSLDVNADTDLAGKPRTEIHALSIGHLGCNFTASLELIDNITQKTVLVVGSKQTYPVRESEPASASTERHP